MTQPYASALTYDGQRPPPAPDQADPALLVTALRQHLARKGAITRAQITAALTAARIPLRED